MWSDNQTQAHAADQNNKKWNYFWMFYLISNQKLSLSVNRREYNFKKLA